MQITNGNGTAHVMFGWEHSPAPRCATNATAPPGLPPGLPWPPDDADAVNHYPEPRHVGVYNVLFCDGHVVAMRDAFAAPAGRSVAAMVAAAQSETELAKAFRNEFIARNRDAARLMLERCIAERLVVPPADIDLALDLVFGPLFYRLLMGHAPITRGFVDQLLDAVIPAPA